MFHSVFIVLQLLTDADPEFIIDYIKTNIFPITVDCLYEKTIDDDRHCVFCMDPLSDRKLLKIRLCKHKFHKECWGVYPNIITCPICRHHLIEPSTLPQMKIKQSLKSIG